MEISAFDVYIIAQIDEIRRGVSFMLFVYILYMIVSFVIHSVTFDSWGDPSGIDREKAKQLNFGRRMLVVVIGFLFVSLLPSTKTAVTMLVAPAVINSQVVQELPDDLHKLIKQLVKEDE